MPYVRPWRICIHDGCDNQSTSRFGKRCSRHYVSKGISKGTKPTVIDWSEKQLCAECSSEMRSQTDSVRTHLVKHKGKGICVRCHSKEGKTSRVVVYKDDEGITCLGCLTHLSFENFTKSNYTSSGFLSKCRRCTAISKHGISSFQYNRMLETQDYKCLICKLPSDKPLSIDHDHTCCNRKNGSCGKCIRGLLCSLCNTGLGMFRDDLETLLAAAEYIKNYKETND